MVCDPPGVGATLPTGTVTFLFTDIEGSTRLLDELGGDAYAEALSTHRHVIRTACSTHEGVVVDTEGDSFFVAFWTARDASMAALAIQKAHATGRVRVRIGVHTGTAAVTEAGYVGMDVHRAARIANAGHGGQIVLSASTRSLLEPRDALLVRQLGEHRLKDLSAAEQLFQLGAGEFPPLRSLSRTNLPVPATRFLGRESELVEVESLLCREDVRLLCLIGPGWNGKDPARPPGRSTGV
jgi:class 3 adenylate cyclase